MKRNLNKIPEIFKVKIDGSTNNFFIAATTIEVKRTEILSGKFTDLGLSFSNENQLLVKEEIFPQPENGRYSKKNQEGWFTIRRDLPKISKEFYLGERPIFGDYSRGTFSMYATRLVYQKDFIPPPELTLSLELLSAYSSDNDEVFILKVSVNQVLNKLSPRFFSDLLFGLNLLQETIHKSDVFESEADDSEYLKVLHIGWELLPVGERELINTLIGNGSRLTEVQLNTIRERYNYLESLNPLEWIKGVSGMRRYFGAKFADDLVVLENMDYGNAIYIMFGNWIQLSQLSRTELLKQTNRDFERIKHNGTGWKIKLKLIIDSKLNTSNTN